MGEIYDPKHAGMSCGNCKYGRRVDGPDAAVSLYTLECTAPLDKPLCITNWRVVWECCEKWKEAV